MYVEVGYTTISKYYIPYVIHANWLWNLFVLVDKFWQEEPDWLS